MEIEKFYDQMKAMTDAIEHLAVAIENNNIDYWNAGRVSDAQKPASTEPKEIKQEPVTAPAPAKTEATPAPEPPKYTIEQLARAAADLVTAGKDPVKLMNSLGAKKLTELPESKYNEFGDGLVQMGAAL